MKVIVDLCVVPIVVGVHLALTIARSSGLPDDRTSPMY